MNSSFSVYIHSLTQSLNACGQDNIDLLCQSLLEVWQEDRQFFLCGNGGSAGNATHLANDLIYGINRKSGRGMRAHALTANASILTCLANDEGYDEIFSKQLAVYARPGDALLVLSGSGNSPNIVKALNYANANGIKTFAILGYDGGTAKNLANTPIHLNIDDMQISEDAQLIIMHYVMQWLASRAEAVEQRS